MSTLKPIPTRRAVGTRRPECRPEPDEGAVEGPDPRARNLTAASVAAAEPLTFDGPPAPAQATPACRPEFIEGPPTAATRPATADEAQARFWRRYGPHLLDAFVGATVPLPETVDGWIALAAAVKPVLVARQAAAKIGADIGKNDT